MHKAAIATVSAIIFTNAAYAGTIGSVLSPCDRVMTLSLGPTITNSNKTQTLYLQSDIQKAFIAHNNYKTLASGEFFIGWARYLKPTLQGQLGLALAGATEARPNGDIWEDADPNFNNFSYQYNINHAHLALKGKLLNNNFILGVMPYLSASAGIGFNKAHSFTINPKIFEEIPPPSFNSHITTAFSYTLGVGIQSSTKKNTQVSIGYELSDWGKSYLNRAPGQTIGQGLRLNHFYTHTLQVGLHFIRT